MTLSQSLKTKDQPFPRHQAEQRQGEDRGTGPSCPFLPGEDGEPEREPGSSPGTWVLREGGASPFWLKYRFPEPWQQGSSSRWPLEGKAATKETPEASLASCVHELQERTSLAQCSLIKEALILLAEGPTAIKILTLTKKHKNLTPEFRSQVQILSAQAD